MNTDGIYELRQFMDNIKITTEKIAHEAVRNKQYIIGTFTPGVGVSFSTAPTVHDRAVQARAECKRLANLHPGKTFFYVQFQGAEMTVPRPNTISI